MKFSSILPIVYSLFLLMPATPASAQSRQLEARIEIPADSTHKYEIDKDTGRIFLDRVVSMPVTYPANYGSLVGTLGDDGDELDALILTRSPIHPGVYVRVRPIGFLRMIDGGEGDDKVICVPTSKVDPTFDDINCITDLPLAVTQRIEAFFRVYKDLPAGRKIVELNGFAKADEALELIRKATAAHEASKP